MLADQLTEIAPTVPEVWGLAALLHFQSSRFDARLAPGGAPIPLDEPLSSAGRATTRADWCGSLTCSRIRWPTRSVTCAAVEESSWQGCHTLRAPGGHLLCVIPVHSPPEYFAANATTWES